MFDEISKVEQKQYKLEQDLKFQYKEIFLSNQGKIVLADLMKACGTLRRASSSDPYINMYERGTQDVVARLFEMLEIDISDLMK